MKDVEWTQSTIDDLASIFEFVSKVSPKFAVHVVDRITNRTIQIASFPYSGAIVPEYRKFDVREVIEFSWRVIYQISDSRIFTLAVVHGTRSLPESILPDTP